MSLRAYVPVCDAIHYLRLLGADCSKYGTLNIAQCCIIMEEYNYLHLRFCRKKQI